MPDQLLGENGSTPIRALPINPWTGLETVILSAIPQMFSQSNGLHFSRQIPQRTVLALLSSFVTQLFDAAGLRLLPKRHGRRGTDPHPLLQATEEWTAAFPGVAPVILDVGANFGDTAAVFLKHFPGSKVYAFEPSPKIFQRLSARYARNANVELVRAAVGETVGHLPFQPDDTDPMLGRLASERSATTVDVEVVTLDDWMEKHGVSGALILQTDTEGNELAVLRGARRTLEAGKIHSILVEVSLDSQNPRHVCLSVVQSLLEPMGFKLWDLYDWWYRPNGSLRFCHALLVRKPAAAE